MHFVRRGELAWVYARSRGPQRAIRRLFFKPPNRSKPGGSYCTAPWKDSYFASDGTVYPCCLMNEKLGDLRTQSWEEIWNGQMYRNLRRTIHGWNPTAVCRACTLSFGITGGDERQYGKYFSRFRVEALALDSPEIDFVEGAHPLETSPEGKASHFWLRRRTRFSIPSRKGAKFVRFLIIPRMPVPAINPGWCRINGGPAEPFDNSCGDITFPITGKRNGRLEIEIEMENEHRVEGDPRDLALAIRGVEFLF